jgi:hypothetical protein
MTCCVRWTRGLSVAYPKWDFGWSSSDLPRMNSQASPLARLTKKDPAILIRRGPRRRASLARVSGLSRQSTPTAAFSAPRTGNTVIEPLQKLTGY